MKSYYTEQEKKERYSNYLKRSLRDRIIIKMILADEKDMEMLEYILEQEKKFYFTPVNDKELLKRMLSKKSRKLLDKMNKDTINN